MKKIVSGADLGGGPIYKSDLREVFNSNLWGALEALLYGFSPISSATYGIRVSGVFATPSGGPYTISAGYVFLDGEFMYYPGGTGIAAPAYIVADTPVNDNRVFADGTTKTLFVTKTAKTQSTVPGSGQHIPVEDFAFDNNKYSLSAILTVYNNLTTNIAQSPLSAAQGKVLQDTKVAKAGDTMIGALVNTDTGEFQGGLRTQASGPYLKHKVINIGTWNMHTASGGTGGIFPSHGISDISKIRSLSVMIISDDGTTVSDLQNDGAYNINGTSVVLARTSSGLFDTTNFNDSINRGWITITYEA